jgi:hypothetical protein
MTGNENQDLVQKMNTKVGALGPQINMSWNTPELMQALFPGSNYITDRPFNGKRFGSDSNNPAFRYYSRKQTPDGEVITSRNVRSIDTNVFSRPATANEITGAASTQGYVQNAGDNNPVHTHIEFMFYADSSDLSRRPIKFGKQAKKALELLAEDNGNVGTTWKDAAAALTEESRNKNPLAYCLGYHVLPNIDAVVKQTQDLGQMAENLAKNICGQFSEKYGGNLSQELIQLQIFESLKATYGSHAAAMPAQKSADKTQSQGMIFG